MHSTPWRGGCRRWDSDPHGRFAQARVRRSRLPIPPRRHRFTIDDRGNVSHTLPYRMAESEREADAGITNNPQGVAN